MSDKPASPTTGEINDIPRRNFVSKFLAIAIGGIVSVLPAIPAVLFFTDPLTRKKRAVGMSGDKIDPEGFIEVTSVDALSDDGLPRQFKVIADLRDFWNKFADTEVGSVYLQKVGDEVVCFNARCPHLGCTVKFDDETTSYVCPCHASSFSLDGQRSNSIPPRDMDELPCVVDDQGVIRVKYQKFRAGIEEKIPV